MADALLPRAWIMRALYLALCIALLFLHLLPLEHTPPKWAGPDLVMALTFAWAVRRPDYVPVLLVGLVILGLDLMLQRPPGLWAALMVMGTQTLRNRAPSLRDLTFAAEWASVASTMVAITIANRVVLTLLMVDQPPLGLSLMQLLSTLIAYPAVAIVSHALFGVRKRAPGDLDTAGLRS
ncbi:MAG: rod shape-determining protein MreD [Roseovarius sp.]|jgi:rod shape-determining protein MreD|uniref:rod shape-determining protein MreD n=1 Tax=Roseovarius sp. TaxID=1486281 RepID=UPI002616D38E|nr:rod shape-determining protein MreD [Roseovarius sp.]